MTRRSRPDSHGDPRPDPHLGPSLVRLATANDGAACAEIYASYVRETAVSFELVPPDTAEMTARLVRTLERTPWLVVEVDGVVRGYAYATRHRERAAYDWTVESAVYVDRAFRGLGLGRMAMAALLRVLRLQGFHLVVAGVTTPNAQSVALHLALGFRRIGEFEAVGWKFRAWHGVEWFGLELRGRSEPAPVRPLPAVREAAEAAAAQDAAGGSGRR
jgi:L-amino acid N-acyltransferase YncA